MKETFGGLEFGLKCFLLSRAWDISISDFETALQHYIGHFLGENIFSYFVWSHNKIPEIILKYKILVFKEKIIIAMMLLARYLNISNSKS